MSTLATELTPVTFDAALADEDVYVVDFWAEWCSPCTAYEPLVEAAVQEVDGGIALGRVDIAAYPELAERCGVSSVPALVVFRRGELAQRIFGVRTRQFLINEFGRLTGAPPA